MFSICPSARHSDVQLATSRGGKLYSPCPPSGQFVYIWLCIDILMFHYSLAVPIASLHAIHSVAKIYNVMAMAILAYYTQPKNVP